MPVDVGWAQRCLAELLTAEDRLCRRCASSCDEARFLKHVGDGFYDEVRVQKASRRQGLDDWSPMGAQIRRFMPEGCQSVSQDDPKAA